MVRTPVVRASHFAPTFNTASAHGELDTDLLTRQAATITNILESGRDLELFSETEDEHLEGIWNLLHAILDAVDKNEQRTQRSRQPTA
jgi:hypothetical protein